MTALASIHSASPSSTVIDVQDLTLLGQQGNVILDQVSCQVKPGGNVILGHNGAGKTSLLHALAGFNTHPTGSIQFGRQYDPTDIAMVFQKPVVLKRTVKQNLEYAASLAKRPNNPMTIDHLLGRLDLFHKQDHHADHLSGGEKQKLALAIALALNPKILILDEPTANIDIRTERQIEELLSELKDNFSLNIILTTHIISQARRLSDYVIFIHEGRITEVTPCQSFFKGPKSEPAKRYLDSFLR